MAVAVKNTTETTPSRLLNPLVEISLGGALYVFGSLGVVFKLIPWLWVVGVEPSLVPVLGNFFNAALLLGASVAGAVGLLVLGLRLLGPHPPHGARAGIFMACFYVVLAGFLTWAVGSLLERWLPRDAEGQLLAWANTLGIVVTALAGVGFLFLGGWMLVRPGFDRRLGSLEDQGWFTTASYKKSQGLRVRRGTIVGLLGLAACGIYTLLAHHTLESGPRHWELVLPFADGKTFTLLPDLRFTVPVLLALAALWFSVRVVNQPTFADFLIATEAELNKVSWTTRKRLVQDTIVVLVTVILLTFFLFVVDMIWGFVLSRPFIGVLQTGTDPNQPPTASQKEQPW